MLLRGHRWTRAARRAAERASGACAILRGMEIEIGRGRKARRAYGLDEIAVLPSRRTRDPDEVDVTWKLGPYRRSLPLMSAPSDAVVSPATAAGLSRLGGLAVLDLEGVWTRYEDAGERLAALADVPSAEATAALQALYAAPVREDLVAARIREIRSEPDIVVAGALSPRSVGRHLDVALDAGLDVLVVRGTVLSAEHSSSHDDVLNLKELVARVPVPVVLGSCASYKTALHLMRTGAAGVLVGIGTGESSTVSAVLGVGAPLASAIADVAAARSTHMLETGEYVQVIADGGLGTGGDVAKAIACGADAVMLGAPLARAAEAPGGGWYWSSSAGHPTLPRGVRVRTGADVGLRELLEGPSTTGDGTVGLMRALRRSMATCGYRDLAAFQRAELVVTPGRPPEGKELQIQQGVGLGARAAGGGELG